MNAEELIKMANTAKAEKDFYRVKYSGLKDFTAVEEIPIINKKELLDFEVAEAKAFWEPNVKATAAVTAGAFKEGTTGTSGAGRLTFPQIGTTEVTDTFSALWSQPIFQKYLCPDGNLPAIICNENFDMARLSDCDHHDMMKLAAGESQNDDRISAEIKAADDRPIAWMGPMPWLDYMIRAGIIQPGNDKHWVLCMPAPKLGFKMDDPYWSKVNRFEFFITTECGIIAYRSSICDCSSTTYHLYRDGIDLYTEIVDGVLCNSMQREILPFIRYSSGDSGKIEDDTKCSCGYAGRNYIFGGR